MGNTRAALVSAMVEVYGFPETEITDETPMGGRCAEVLALVVAKLGLVLIGFPNTTIVGVIRADALPR